MGASFRLCIFHYPWTGAGNGRWPTGQLIIGALETAFVTGGLTALGGALASIGIPEDSVIQYEAALKADKFILIVHGSIDEVVKARNILMENKAEEATVHH
uniref:hypothetical protein n=1 Tax=Crenothrix polyspora TaxID=360316 RepID=UPI001C501C2A|nr:hypothetical protein [Crenothrix polyspora]